MRIQPDGGVLLPEKAIGLFVAAAQDGGATVRLNTPVRAFSRRETASGSGLPMAK